MKSLPHAVYLYTAKPDTIDLADSKLLNTAEQQRAAAFRFANDRVLYTAAHVFLRQTLSQHADVSPADWQFSSNAYGKPAITNHGCETLQFNLSHTRGLLACAISQGRAVGVDVERHKPLHDLENLCRTALAAPETAEVLSHSLSEGQIQRFFTYWTLKEAYIKARGLGLSIPLQQFHFQQTDGGEWRLHCQRALQDHGTHWQFLSQQVENSYHLALAVQVDEINAELTIHEYCR